MITKDKASVLGKILSAVEGVDVLEGLLGSSYLSFRLRVGNQQINVFQALVHDLLTWGVEHTIELFIGQQYRLTAEKELTRCWVVIFPVVNEFPEALVTSFGRRAQRYFKQEYLTKAGSEEPLRLAVQSFQSGQVRIGEQGSGGLYTTVNG